jgi:hypothetical protein
LFPFVAFPPSPEPNYIRIIEFNCREIVMSAGGGDGCGRRRALSFFAAAAGVSGLQALFGAAPAQAKTSQAAAGYRNSPKGRQSCANCSWYEAPSGCGVVKGPVSAHGWCALWG